MIWICKLASYRDATQSEMNKAM